MKDTTKERLINILKKEYLLECSEDIQPNINVCDGIVSITFEDKEK